MASTIFPHSDKFASVERHTRLYGDVAGYAHDGDTYCPECAKDYSEIDREQYRERPETVAYGGAIRTHEEWDIQPHCGNSECGRKLDVRVFE